MGTYLPTYLSTKEAGARYTTTIWKESDIAGAVGSMYVALKSPFTANVLKIPSKH